LPKNQRAQSTRKAFREDLMIDPMVIKEAARELKHAYWLIRKALLIS
jgi:hypothetical protein